MSIGVGFGLAFFPFSDVANYWRWVALCEEGGVDSLWQTDRLVSREPILECMSAMAALAGATKRIKFGMNVASVGLRDPLLLAKQCATIDHLSGGRLLPAFGLGSNRGPDWRASGHPTEGRGARMNEALEIIARLWRGESVTHHSAYFHYSDARIAPLPAQKQLPLWIGGSSAAAVERTARYGTGWQAAFETPEEAGAAVRAIHRRAGELGRRLDPDHFGTGFGVRFGRWEDAVVERTGRGFQSLTGRDPGTAFAVGDEEEILARIWAYADAGLAKFILRPMGEDDADVLRQSRLLIERVLPRIPGLERQRKASMSV